MRYMGEQVEVRDYIHDVCFSKDSFFYLIGKGIVLAAPIVAVKITTNLVAWKST